MLIEMINIAVKLDGQSILHDINLKLESGKITAIFGPSGSGLSTLLKTAAGLVTPSSGHVLYDGQDLASLGEKDRQQLQTQTGFMFQDTALWANMSLAANLDLPLHAKFPDMSKRERDQRVEASLQHYGFDVDTQKRPVDISWGQKKFISFLRAVIPGPQALFLDEPTALMDRFWADKVKNEMIALRTKGITQVFAGNQYDSTFELADYLVVLHQGQILGQDDREKIIQTSDPDIRSILDGQTVE